MCKDTRISLSILSHVCILNVGISFLKEDENSSNSSVSTLKSSVSSNVSNSKNGGNGSRLSVRSGRSVVHKNLEDNYGAVISANHEALAQILEQVSGWILKLEIQFMHLQTENVV